MPPLPKLKSQPYTEMAKEKAIKFIVHTQTQTLNHFGLEPGDIALLSGKGESELALRVIEAAHRIFRGYRTDSYPIADKLNRKGASWDSFGKILAIGGSKYGVNIRNLQAIEMRIAAIVFGIITQKVKKNFQN